jgi:hypothetical protein
MNRHETEAALAKYSTETEFFAVAEAWAREQGFDSERDAAFTRIKGTLLWCIWMLRDIDRRLPPLARK